MDKIKPFEAVVRFEPTSNVRVNGDVHTCRCDEVIVQQLVRCEDCVHWKDEGFDSAGKCELWNIVFEYDWFCADGERIEE